MTIPDRTVTPCLPPRRPWELPAVHSEVFPNGLRLRVIQLPACPVVSSTLVILRGANEDPPGKHGSAFLTGEGLDTGTPSRDALAISRALEQMGTEVRTDVGHDGTAVTVRTLPRFVKDSLEVVSDFLLRPQFPHAELERIRKKSLNAIAQQKTRPAFLANLVTQRLLYGDEHPYGTEVGGTESTVRALERDVLVQMHAGCFLPGLSTLIVIGPLSFQEVHAVAEEFLGGWRTGAAIPLRDAANSPPYSNRAVIVDRAGSPQSEIRVAMPSLKRNSPDFFSAILLNRILGGQFTSRLNKNLRERRGLTYGAWSMFGFGRLGGPFMIGTAVDTARTDEAVLAIREELSALQESGPGKEELDRAKEGICGAFSMMFETPGQITALLKNQVLYALPEDYFSTYLEQLHAVTLEQVATAAQRYLEQERMLTVVVGDQRSVRPQLDRVISHTHVSTPAEIGL